jgi:hypothetical protein
VSLILLQLYGSDCTPTRGIRRPSAPAVQRVRIWPQEGLCANKNTGEIARRLQNIDVKSEIRVGEGSRYVRADT